MLWHTVARRVAHIHARTHRRHPFFFFSYAYIEKSSAQKGLTCAQKSSRRPAIAWRTAARLLLQKRLLLLIMLLRNCRLVEMFAKHEVVVAACCCQAASLLALCCRPVAILAYVQLKPPYLMRLLSCQSWWLWIVTMVVQSGQSPLQFDWRTPLA